jgi:protein-S-isoprenylcysteine O-methyltransferase Ste14
MASDGAEPVSKDSAFSQAGGRWSGIARRIRVPVGFALAVLYMILARPTPGSLLLGATVTIPGLLLRTLASGHVQKNEVLTTGGPYAYTRNPLYLGSLIVAAGFAIAARSWWIVALMVLIFLGIYLPVIRAEESFLRHRFPEYADYAERVPQLLPRFGSFGHGGSFSWDLYRKHREYNAILGTAAVFAALLAKLLWMSN